MIEARASTWDALWALLWPFRGPRLCLRCGGAMEWMRKFGRYSEWDCPSCERQRHAAFDRELQQLMLAGNPIQSAVQPTPSPRSGRPTQA